MPRGSACPMADGFFACPGGRQPFPFLARPGGQPPRPCFSTKYDCTVARWSGVNTTTTRTSCSFALPFLAGLPANDGSGPRQVASTTNVATILISSPPPSAREAAQRDQQVEAGLAELVLGHGGRDLGVARGLLGLDHLDVRAGPRAVGHLRDAQR